MVRSFPWGLQVPEGGRSERAASGARGWSVGAKICIAHLLPANFLGDFNAFVHS